MTDTLILAHEQAVREFDAAGAGTYVLAKYALNDTRAALQAVFTAKDGAYSERNKIAAGLARLFRSWVGTPVPVDEHGNEWPVLYIELPTGQVSWHFSAADAALLEGIPRSDEAWDGHTTDEKYTRLQALTSITTLASRLEAEA